MAKVFIELVIQVGKLSSVLLNREAYHHIERSTDWNMKTEH